MKENKSVPSEIQETISINKEQEVRTLRHALNKLTQSEIHEELEVLNIVVDLDKLTKKSDLIDYIVYMTETNQFKEGVFEAFRERAFNLNLDATDGFFLAFLEEWKFNEREFQEKLEEWNKEVDDSLITLRSVHMESKRAIVEISRLKEKFIFDQQSMYSTSYFEEDKGFVELYFNEKIIYFQTTNIKVFHSIKTVVRKFLMYLFNITKIKLIPPKMEQKLRITFTDTKDFAIDDRTVNPSTIKLMDLLLELDNPETNFNGFECIEITFDHEDSVLNKHEKSRIDSQSYGGGDLLSKDDVKKLILNNRSIINVEIKFEYNEQISSKSVRIHTILGGVSIDRLNGLRLYIKNSEFSIKRVLEKAYIDLKGVFIQLYSQNSLKNEEKIKTILGLDNNEKSSG